MPEGLPPSSDHVRPGRRQVLGWGAGVAAGLAALGASGFTGHELWPAASSSSASGSASSGPPDLGDPAADPASYMLFFSRPDLRPPRVVTVPGAPGYQFGPGRAHVLLTPKGYAVTAPSQMGVMILDGVGRLRWFQPTHLPFDLQRQTYRGKPVLTWWEGVVHLGTGSGTVKIVDTSFRPVATISEVDGLHPDLHEASLTPSGTALVSAYHNVKTDLRSVGGPKKGWVQAPVALEVDVASGKLVHRWDALEHVGVEESFRHFYGGTEQNPFDYLHLNSICLAPDGNLLIGARNSWALYKVDRRTGEILWRLNGKKSDFEMGPGARFYWQHHARAHGPSELTLFDDGGTPAEEAQARGLVLHLDEQTMKCNLVKSFTHPARLMAANQGSMQLLADGGAFVGWGDNPYFSRFSASGDLLVDGVFPVDVESYRCFVADLALVPDEPPALAIGPSPTGGTIAYVSWNGSTEVARWDVLAGRSAHDLKVVATQAWADFETEVTVDSEGPYFQAVARDSSGRELERSEVRKR